jgi:transaldolase/glucose-6-phosphate isomerase
VVRIGITDPYTLGQEFFRWQIATAVAASILGVHPFDQPDVDASRLVTRRLIGDYERIGTLPEEVPLVSGEGVTLFADERNAVALAARVSGDRTWRGYLKAHLDRLEPDDYFALLAYVEMSAVNQHWLQAVRHQVRDARRVATCAQFGPRFLHSTGQLYKGGPNTGVFLQITCDDGADLAVPGKGYSFGVVKAAQARGDFQVLVERNRRALRIHLGVDVAAGLATLHDAMRAALSSNAMTFV